MSERSWDAEVAADPNHWSNRAVRLERELEETKAGYRSLDANWAAIHEGAMGPLRAALKMPDGTVPGMVAAIERLLRIEEAAKPILANMDGICGGDCQEPSFAGFMHAACPKCAAECGMPMEALKDQTMLNNLKTALTPLG